MAKKMPHENITIVQSSSGVACHSGLGNNSIDTIAQISTSIITNTTASNASSSAGPNIEIKPDTDPKLLVKEEPMDVKTSMFTDGGGAMIKEENLKQEIKMEEDVKPPTVVMSSSLSSSTCSLSSSINTTAVSTTAGTTLPPPSTTVVSTGSSGPPVKQEPLGANKVKFTKEELKEALLPPLDKLYAQEPESIPFRVPVDPKQLNIPDYFDIIKKPMDMSCIRNKLDNGGYQDPWEFVDDVWLMFENAWIYNRKTSRVYKYCTKVNLLQGSS